MTNPKRPERATLTEFLADGPNRPDVWVVTFDNGDAMTFSGWVRAYDYLKALGFRGVDVHLDYWTRTPA